MSIREDYRAMVEKTEFSEDFEERTVAKLCEIAENAEKNAETDESAADEIGRESPFRAFFGSGNKVLRRAIAAVAAIMLFTSTAFAAEEIINRLTPVQVAEKAAEEMGNSSIIEAFNSPDAVMINETKESNGWKITLLGKTTGDAIDGEIEDFWSTVSASELKKQAGLEGDYAMIMFDPYIDGIVGKHRNYVAVAVEKADGTPLTESSELPMISAFIDGYTPSKVNSWSMGFSSYKFVEDGVAYYFFDFADLGAFGGHTVRLAAHDAFIPDDGTFVKSAEGKTVYADGYGGTKAMFELPVEPTAGDNSEALNLADLFESIDNMYYYVDDSAKKQ